MSNARPERRRRRIVTNEGDVGQWRFGARRRRARRCSARPRLRYERSMRAETRDQVLRSVDFGRYEADGDSRLLEYFLETGATRRAAAGTQLVIGRKGSGKTALFQHLAATLDHAVVELDLSEYVFQAHDKLREDGIPAAFAYATSWRLIIAAAMFAKLRKSMSFWHRRRGKKLLREIGLGSNRGAFGAMAEWLQRVRRLDLPGVEGIATLGGIELGDSQPSLIDVRTIQLLDELEGLLAKVVLKSPVTVLVDRLDDAWDGSEDSLRLIIGAVRASRHFARRFGQQGTAPVIIFLRSDLWERLDFNDKNKTGQVTIYLDWRDEELVEIIERRIRRSTNSESEGWGTIFTSEEMRQRAGTQTYILKRTLGRPRDIVAFSVFAREIAVQNGHSIIEKADIYAAERRYSKHALDELRDEIAAHVSSFAQVMETLQRLGRRTFTVSEWNAAASESGMTPKEASEALDQLFESSTVGVLQAGGSSGGSGTRYRYQDRFLRSNASAVLQVHLAFVRELSLTDR